MSFTLSSLLSAFLKIGAVALVVNEIRGIILAVPVLWAMYQSGGSAMAIWLGLCSLGGIALSVIVPLFAARRRYDLILVDVGPGVSATVVSLALACDRLVLVTTPEPTSLADAYATLKVVTRERRDLELGVLVNLVRDGREARDAHARLGRLSRRFLDFDPPYLGELAWDARFGSAAKSQQPLVQVFPTATSSRQLARISDGLRVGKRRSRPEAEIAGAVKV